MTAAAIPVRMICDGRGVVLIEPNACQLCGTPSPLHGRRWTGGHRQAGTDLYAAPDDATRLARMKARRAEVVR